MQQVCHSAVSIVGPLEHGDAVFNCGEVPEQPRMFFVLSGQFDYMHGAVYRGAEAHELHPGDWVSEHPLWIPWRHCGTLRAANECRLLAVDADTFQELVKRFFSSALHLNGVHPSKYALEFVKIMNQLDWLEINDLTIDEDVEHAVERAYPKSVRFDPQGQVVCRGG